MMVDAFSICDPINLLQVSSYFPEIKSLNILQCNKLQTKYVGNNQEIKLHTAKAYESNIRWFFGTLRNVIFNLL